METLEMDNLDYRKYDNTEDPNTYDQWVQVRLGMSDAVMDVLRHFGNASGRAARSEFWWWILFAAFVCCAMWDISIRTTLYFLWMIPVVVSIVPTFTAAVRRLHDTDHSGWNMLFLLLPVFGWIWLLLLWLAPSTDGENDYGDCPNMVRSDLL